MNDRQNDEDLPAAPAAGAGSPDDSGESGALPVTPAAPEPLPPGPRSEAAAPGGRRPTRPNLLAERVPVSREHAGYAFVLEPPELARLRELPGARGKTDEELGAEFLEAQAERLTTALAGDPPAPATIQVLVDPYSRQVFLAVENRVRGIVSF